MAFLMMSAARPWTGVLTAAFSAATRARWFEDVMSGIAGGGP